MSSITPTTVTAGSGALTLTINGTGFLSTTTVQVGDAADATTYVSATQVTATVTAQQLVSGAELSVIALNGTASSGSGTAVNLEVTNPAPTITALSPATEVAGTAPPLVAVSGTGFVPTTVINVGGSGRTTTFVSATQVDVLLTAADVATAGSLTLTAVNATPGGGTSTGMQLTISSPSANLPTVTSIVPATVTAGSGPLTLTVNGSGFLSTTTIQVGGVTEATSFVSGTQVTATVTAAQLASGTQLPVIAVNGTVNSGSGAAINLQVTNPAPTITQLIPATVLLTATSPVVSVAGTGFVPTTAIDVNGSARTTVFVSGTQVDVALTAADLATTGSLSLTAVNPTPGGGTSAAVTEGVNNPAPGVPIKISPSLVFTGATMPTTITVTGTNFIPASTVELGNVPVTTTYVSATQLTFQLSVAQEATSQYLSVAVMNPTPGGGTTIGTELEITPQTPTPVITQVQPTQFYVQTGATTITVYGNNLLPLSSSATVVGSPFPSVLWNGTALTLLETCNGCGGGGESIVANVPGSLVASAGTASITVSSPTSVPAVSNALPVTITNPPTPTLTSIMPNSGLVDTETTVTLTGTGFASSSVVTLNGTTIASVYYNSTQLAATIPASSIASAGTVNLTVTTPAPGGGTSGALPFTVTVPPAPTLTQIYPGGGPINTAASLTLYGTGFTSSSTVAANGTNIAATYVNSTELTVTIPASAVTVPGNLNLTVTTPAPGGGTSAPLPYTAYLAITNNDLVYSPVDGLLYVSVPGSASSMGNNVVGIDPVTGNVVRQIFAGSNPNKLALSSDGTQLFVGLDGAGAVAQVSLATGLVAMQFPLGVPSTYGSINTATAIAAVPGEPNSVAVTSTNDAVTIYDSGVARAETSASLNPYYYGPLSFGSSASILYVAGSYQGIGEFTVGPTGITAEETINSSSSSSDITNIQYDNGQLYLANGTVLNASSGALQGTFYATATNPATGPIVSDSTLGLAFIANASGVYNTSAVLAFNEATFNEAGGIDVNGVNNGTYPYGFEKIVRWGQDGIALNTSSQIFIFESPVVKDLSSSPADLAVTLSAPATATTGTAITYTATVADNGPNQAQGPTLSLTLDPSLIINSVIASQGSCGTGNAFNCDLGSLTNGASAMVTVSATPTTSGTIEGIASVSSVSYDPNSSNDQATSNTTVTGNLYGAAPLVSAISPALVQAGSATFTLTVTGSGFNPGSIVNVGGTAETTSYVSATQLTASVDSSLVANYGWAPVTVSNPTPGGGTSAVVPLTIYDLVNVPANAILFEPYTQQIYATVPGNSISPTGNSVVAINPVTGSVGTPINVGSQPTVMTETEDGNYLYIGLSGANSLAQFNVLNQTLVATYPLSITQYGSTNSTVANWLSAMPGTDTTLAIAAEENGSVGIFDISGGTGTFRPNFSPDYGAANPAFASASELYASEDSGSEFYRFGVNASGLTAIDETNLNGLGGGGIPFVLAGGIVYGGTGGIINPSTTPPSQIATLPLVDYYQSGISPEAVGVVADPSTQRDFLMLENTAGTWEYALARYNTTTYLPETWLVMPASTWNFFTGWTMLRWGQDGLALLAVADTQINSQAVTQILLLQGPFVTPQLLGTNSAASLTSSSASSITHGAGNTMLTLTGSNLLPGVAVTWNGNYRTTTIVDGSHVTVAIPASDLASAGSGSLVATNPGAPASNALTVTIN